MSSTISNTQVVHVETQLKPYHLGGSQTQKTSPHPGPDTETTSSPTTTPAHSSCEEEEEQYYLAASSQPDAEQVLCRSTRQTRFPDRYGEFVTHNLSTRMWISERGSSVTKTSTLLLTNLVSLHCLHGLGCFLQVNCLCHSYKFSCCHFVYKLVHLQYF